MERHTRGNVHKTRLLSVALVFLPFLLVACGASSDSPTAPKTCNALTCDSRVEARFGEPIATGAYTVEVCLDELCETAAVTTDDPNRVPLPSGHELTLTATAMMLYIEEGSPLESAPNTTVETTLHHLTVSLSTDDQQTTKLTSSVEFNYEILQPNGPGCAPVCSFAAVRLPEFDHH